MIGEVISKRVLPGLDWCVTRLSRTGVSENFIRFGIVGSMGFCWDTATVYALKAHLGLYAAGTCGFLVAATANWIVNRLWTFRDHVRVAAHIQWAKFMAANFVGFIVNRGAFFSLIAMSELCRAQPFLPIIAGSVAGICFNYFLSKRLVFS